MPKRRRTRPREREAKVFPLPHTPAKTPEQFWENYLAGAAMAQAEVDRVAREREREQEGDP